MSNFVTKLVFNAIDNVSKTAAIITKSVKGLETQAKTINGAFGQVAVNGAIFASKLKYLGLAAAGAGVGLFVLADRTSEAAEQLLNLSQKTGVSVEELQKLSYATDQSGLSTDSLTTSFKFLNKAIADASVDAGSEAATAFTAMGISVQDANGNLKSTEDIFYQLSDVFKNAPDGPNKVRTALTLLGRAGTDLIPLLNKGSQSLKTQGAQFAKYGNLLDKGALEKIEKFNDQVKDVKIAFSGLGSVIAEALIPYLGPLTEKFSNYIAANKNLIKLNIAEFVGNMAKKFEEFWPKVTKVASAFSAFLDKIGGVSTVIKGLAIFIAVDLVASFSKLAVSILTLGRVFLATPFGLVVTGIGLIAYGVYELNKAFPELGDAVIGTVSIMAEKFAAFFATLWEGFKKTLEYLNIIDEETKKQEQLKAGGTVKNNGFATTLGEDGQFRTTSESSFNDNPGLSAGANPTAAATPGGAPDAGGAQGILDMISSLAAAQKQALDINLNLNTENKVTYADIDSPMTTSVNISNGPMFSY